MKDLGDVNLSLLIMLTPLTESSEQLNYGQFCHTIVCLASEGWDRSAQVRTRINREGRFFTPSA